MPASVGTRAKLYRRALGLCAMEGCNADLEFDTSAGPEFIAEAAHIHGEHEGSARYLAELPMHERNAVGNLVLMCPTHHGEIDADEETWPAERVRELKAAHEERAYLMLQAGKGWKQKFLTLDYLNLPRLAAMPGGGLLQLACEKQGLNPGMTFRDLGWGVGSIERAARSLFAEWDARLVPLTGIDLTVAGAGAGQIVWFDQTSYTRNGPIGSKTQPLTGDLDLDPHIWFRQGDVKVAVRYDPAWVTTSTAFVNLNSGTTRFAGFGTIVHRDGDTVLVSAWAFGKPMTPEIEPFYRALQGDG